MEFYQGTKWPSCTIPFFSKGRSGVRSSVEKIRCVHICFNFSKKKTNEFCLKLANQVVLKQAKSSNGLVKNIACSPLSFNAILNMAAAGSTGSTLEQFLHYLGSESLEDLNSKTGTLMSLVGSSESLVLSFVSGVWMDQSFPLKPSYQHLVQGLYKAQANTVDFQHKADEVKDEINRWAENETKGLIKDLVSHLSGDLRIVLANALYFKGTWERMFDVSRTRNRDFHLLNGEKVSVPFMTSSYSQFFGSFDGFKLVKIPYQKGEEGRQFSMYIYLPNERDGLQNLVQELESNHWFLHQLSNLRLVQLDAFLIPKFKFSYDFDSEAIIKSLGLTRPFEPRGELTEISSCSDSKLLNFSKVIQKCYIEVNEEGTEAAAATIFEVYGCSPYSVAPPKPTFVADHPFVFMIMEETSGAVLFTGAVINPLL